MKRHKSTKSSRPKKSLYYVDNPNINELKLLEERKESSRSGDKRFELHESPAPVLPALPEQEKEAATASPGADPEHGNVDGNQALQELLSEKPRRTKNGALFIPTISSMRPSPGRKLRRIRSMLRGSCGDDRHRLDRRLRRGEHQAGRSGGDLLQNRSFLRERQPLG